MRKAALFLLMLASPGLAQIPAAPAAGQKPGEPLPQRSAQKTYASTCGYCHGTNVGPIILGRHLRADYVRTMVRAGRNGMPAFRPSEITPAELDALTTWVSTSPGNPAEHGQ